MRATWLLWVWPIIILLFTLAVTLVTFLFPDVGIRPEVMMCFLFVIPGMTVTRFFRIADSAVEWMLILALSFTIDAFVAGSILYAGQWSPTRIISFLLGFCFSGAIAQLVIIHPDMTLFEPAPANVEDEVTLDLENIKDTEVTLDLENIKDIEEKIKRSNRLFYSTSNSRSEKTVSSDKSAFGEASLKR